MPGTEKAIAFRWAASLAAIPAPLEGKRRVTEAVAAMIVNTLVPAGANGNWQLAIGKNQNPFTTEGTEKHHYPPFASPSTRNPRMLGAPQDARKGLIE